MGATKDTKIDIEVYNGVVDEIETQNDTVIEDGFVATSASSIISTNATVPTFVRQVKKPGTKGDAFYIADGKIKRVKTIE